MACGADGFGIKLCRNSPQLMNEKANGKSQPVTKGPLMKINLTSARKALLALAIGSIVATGMAQTQYQWTNFAGMPGQGTGSTDGTGTMARFNAPQGVALDSGSNVYVADLGNNTIRMITPAGVVTTLAGTPGTSGTANGTGSAARFNWPSGVAVDSGSNVYVADRSNHTIRKITPAGVVTTLAGTPGTSGTADGTGSAAQFNYPSGVAVDSGSNVYVADDGNFTIRKITPAGVVTTLAGTPAQSGFADGTGTSARFSDPLGIAVDSGSNVYVAESLISIIRMITPAGVVTTIGGQYGTAGSADGTGTSARFSSPTEITVDQGGNLFVADLGNNRISMGAYSPVAPWLISNGFAYNTALTNVPNNDGVPLLMDYALNLDPTQNQSASIPKPVVSGSQMSLTFYGGSAGVTYIVQTSTDLQYWSTSGVTFSGPDAYNNFTATIPITGSKEFMRLKVTY